MTITPTQSATSRAPAVATDRLEARPAAAMKKTTSPYQQFEAFVLQSFIQSMLPSEASEVYGQGTAGEVWKSMLAEKMAKEISDHGGIGIAKMIAPKDGAPAGQGEAAARSSAAGRIADWQMVTALAPASTVAKRSE